MTGDLIPEIASAKMIIEFADGRSCVFEAKDPGPSAILIEHSPPVPGLDQWQPASPDLIHGLGSIGEPGGITLRIRAAFGHTLRYLDAR